ncbi:hypothetical protein FHS55_004565 [Angulomicrobium tetraedrale]|uniref:Uncharacterized protein n=1 Tax=Ancylobacter tetraedralis TaxID=217068 RepID=A0A839ZGF8_9HYPH|nr:hypothetical protein [Ancylobacter tetraedralis]
MDIAIRHLRPGGRIQIVTRDADADGDAPLRVGLAGEPRQKTDADLRSRSGHSLVPHIANAAGISLPGALQRRLYF